STSPRALTVLLVPLLIGVTARPSHAFKIDVGQLGGAPIHEGITSDAIRTVTPTAPAKLIDQIVFGVRNADIAHFNEPRFHFDNAARVNRSLQAGIDHVMGRLRQAVD